MDLPLEQHQLEILRNKKAWESKPMLRQIYAHFYRRIEQVVEKNVPGALLEIGSGMGLLKTFFPEAICSDLFPNPWLDLVCDGYDLPFRNQSLSNIILFDVFHHLQRPVAFLKEAQRCLIPGGRLILFEPFISLTSRVVYGLAHHEPVGWNRAIEMQEEKPARSIYYAAQGNATRLIFRGELKPLPGWNLVHQEAFASFAYLLSGGFSKPALYPAMAFKPLFKLDQMLSRMPGIFGARCLIALQKRTV